MTEEKQYCGIGKKRTAKTKEGKEFSTLGIAFSPEHLTAINNWAATHDGWASINVNERLKPSNKGVTHTVSLNTYVKPDAPEGSRTTNLVEANDPGNVPF